MPIPRAGDVSGVTVVVKALVAEHARQGGESTVVVDQAGQGFPGGHAYRVDYRAVSPDRDWTRVERATDAALGLLGRPRRFAPRMYGPAADALRAVEPDVVLMHEGHFAVTALPMLRELPRSRVYLYVHNPISRSIARPELRRLLAGTRGIIAVSEFVAEQVSYRVGRGGPPISVVHNGVDLALFAPPAEPVANEVPRVVFAGRIGPGKGVDKLVDASVQLHSEGVPHRLTVVGRALHHTGPELSSFEQDLRRRAAPAGRGIDFLPFLPPHELAGLFGQADIVCVPTVASEPFGLVAMEAMASGACVVVSSRGALPEIVGHSGVVVEPEVGPLREALADVLLDRDRREALASSGVARARAFSWEASHRRLVSVLAES